MMREVEALKEGIRMNKRKGFFGTLAAMLVLSLFAPAAVFAAQAEEDAKAAAAGTGAVRFEVSQGFSFPKGADVSGNALAVSYELTQSARPDDGTPIQSDKEYTIKCTGSDGKTGVLPENSTAVFTMEGDGAAASVEASFRHAGVYKFILKPSVQSRTGYEYDTTAYTLRFYVKNQADGSLQTVMYAESNKDHYKPDQISWEHSYTPETEPVTPAKPTAPAKPGKTTTTKSTAVKTGDGTNLTLYIALLAASAAALTGLAVHRKKQRL